MVRHKKIIEIARKNLEIASKIGIIATATLQISTEILEIDVEILKEYGIDTEKFERNIQEMKEHINQIAKILGEAFKKLKE